MVKLDAISEHVVVDTSTQRTSRSCVLGGISLGEYSIAIESGHALEVGLALRKELEATFKIPTKYLFLSHTHNDHRDGRGAFNDTILIASQRCLDNMPQRIRLTKWAKEAFDGTFTLKTDEGTVEFHHTGGHSFGHSIAYFPTEKILFGCDLFIVKSVNFGLPFLSFYQNKPKRTGDPEAYLAAYRKFLTMDLEVIVPGHGDLVHDPQPYLKDQIAFFEELKAFTLTAIKEGKSLEEIQLPRLGPIEQAYRTAESRSKRAMNLRFLENYLTHLKTSFFNYYSQVQ